MSQPTFQATLDEIRTRHKSITKQVLEIRKHTRRLSWIKFWLGALFISNVIIVLEIAFLIKLLS